MCDPGAHSSSPSPLEKHINDKKLAIDLLKISDNTYVGFREAELAQLNRFIRGRIESRAGGSLFVFGLSGTGKTTTVGHALSQCADQFKGVATVSLSGSSYISMKAFKNDFYHRVLGFTPAMAAKTLGISSRGRVQNYAKFTSLLVEHFRAPPNVRICLIDEIDYLSTFFSNLRGYDKSNWLIHALFRAACSRGSKVVIVAISNNLEFATKIRAESCERLLFKPYNETQMVSIVMEKLKSLDDESSRVLNRSALLLLARRVANTSGDCRTYLDSFILAALEKDSQSLASLETSSGPESLTRSELDSERPSQECEPDEFRTPTRNLREMGRPRTAPDLSKYNVGTREIGVVTPTLSLNKREQLKQKLQDLPVLQLLLLLAFCKSSIVVDQVISANDAKVRGAHAQKFFLELAEKLDLDAHEAESFCNAEFEASLEHFRQLGLISKTGGSATSRRNALQNRPRERGAGGAGLGTRVRGPRLRAGHQRPAADAHQALQQPGQDLRARGARAAQARQGLVEQDVI